MQRTLIVTFFGLVLFLLMGCNENSLNGPALQDSFDKTEPEIGSVQQGTIILDQELPSPNRPGEYFKIDGSIFYTQEFLEQNVSTTAAGYEARINIFIDAALTDLPNDEGNIWKISDETKELVTIPIREPVLFEKTFPVHDRNDRLELVCTFEASIQGLKLKSAVLQSAVV